MSDVGHKPAPAAVLMAKRLTFSYPGRQVFNAWSMDFPPGLTWVRGPNGCGKSTLLQLLAGALSLRSGALSVIGIDSTTSPIDYRRQVFWCGSGGIAFDHLRPLEYFGFMRGLYPRFDVEVLQKHIAGFELAPHLDRRLATLSTGTQRKVWLAAALSANTAAVLIDEPVNALDTASIDHLHRALMQCAADLQCAWIVTSHEPLGAAGRLARCLELQAEAAP